MPLNSSQLIVADINTYRRPSSTTATPGIQRDDPDHFRGVALIDAQIYAYKKSGGKS